jgi:molybdopterin-guanine dinucleotide biosynthesis protein A
MSDWSAALLVGGRGRRLGGQTKPLLAVEGATILERQLAACATLGITPTLVAPDGRPFAGLPHPIVRDAVDAGALGALYTALVTASTAYVLVVAGDLPFVTAPFLAHLVSRRHAHDAVVPAPAGRPQPLCAVYSTAIAPRLGRRIEAGQLRVTDALADLRVDLVDDAALAAFDRGGRLLLNVNTPKDHELARYFAALGD